MSLNPEKPAAPGAAALGSVPKSVENQRAPFNEHHDARDNLR